MGETAIILPILDAEPAIGHFRRQHTEDGAQGAPPHVTLLYPFTDSSRIDRRRIKQAADIVGAFDAFEFALATIAHFPGSPRVLYLEPSPEMPFREMTRALAAAFPEHPPYSGDRPDPTPHATVAVADDQILAEVERELVASLPITTHATGAALMEHDDEHNVWRVREYLHLGSTLGRQS